MRFLLPNMEALGKLFLLVLVLFGGAAEAFRDLDCDPCIRRSEYRIQAIVHGTDSDPFWLQVRASAVQAAKDMGVDFEMDLYDSRGFSATQMAEDIRAAAASEYLPDALLVSLPDAEVRDAVINVVREGSLPVFAMNNGYEDGPLPGILGFVGQDEYRAGVEAANEFIDRTATKQQLPNAEAFVQRALFINHEKGNPGLDARFRGFSDALSQQGTLAEESIGNENIFANNSFPDVPDIRVDEMIIDDRDDVFSLVTQLNSEVFPEGCPYDAVLLASGASISLDLVLAAFEEKGCKGTTMLGSFDKSPGVFAAIANGQVEFTISQQQHLQGALSVIMATLFVTTGKSIVPPADTEIFMTGPALINSQNLPTDQLQACATDSFPTCSNLLSTENLDNNPSSSDCKCVERENIRIGGVVHGVTFNPFFSRVLAASQQAAIDMGIELDFELLSAEENKLLVYQKMAARIKALCESGVDGIFVSIPDDIVIESIQLCQDLGVPIMSINSGAAKSEELDLWLHIGQLETTAGYGAAKRLIEAGMTTGYCILHDRRNSALVQRCEGFQAGIEDTPGITFGGIIEVPGDNTILYKSLIEDFVTEQGIATSNRWDGIGILSLAAQHINRALAVKDDHEDLLVGSFDLSEDMLNAIGEGRVQFGIDQQPTMQGMMPVYLLTWAAYSKQRLLSNHNFETGPRFVETAPSVSATFCDNNNFAVCALTPDEDLNYIAPGMKTTGYVLVSLVFLVSFACLFWMFWFRKTSPIVKLSQPRYLVMLLVGAMVSTLSIVTMGVETGYRINNPDIGIADAACMATPWLYGIGFVIMFSALFAKIWKVKLIYNASRNFRRVSVSQMDVSYLMYGIVLLEVAILLSWQLISPDRWTRTVILTQEDGLALESFGECSSEDGGIFLATLVAFHVLLLFYALVLCLQTRNIPSDFAESNWISLSVMCLFQVLVLAIPIYILVEDDIDVFYFVRAVMVFLQNFTVICLIFIPKMLKQYNGKDRVVLETVVEAVRGGRRTSVQDLRDTRRGEEVSNFESELERSLRREKDEPEQAPSQAARSTESSSTSLPRMSTVHEHDDDEVQCLHCGRMTPCVASTSR